MGLENFDKMGTFFEKLTGAPAASQPAPTANPVFSNAPISEDEVRKIKKERGPLRAAKTEAMAPEGERTKHPKVETEGPKNTPAEETPEEEGELTVDIYDRGDAIVIQSTVAGVKPEDLDISITSDTVTIRGKRIPQEKIEEKNYYYKELFWGAFARTVILPEEIEDSEAEATMKNGLLTIVLPKKTRRTIHKLKVKAA